MQLLLSLYSATCRLNLAHIFTTQAWCSMVRNLSSNATSLLYRRHIFVYLGLATATLLLIPYAAMQLTGEVSWSSGDFIIMGLLLFLTSSAFVVIARKVAPAQRLWVALGVALVFLYCWAELAVGIFFQFGS